MSKIYRGQRLAELGNNFVSVDGERLKHIERHSPDGFEWGYGGSGPADLALSILTEHFGHRGLAEKYYQAFKTDFVSGFAHKEWELSSSVIDKWILAETGYTTVELVTEFQKQADAMLKEV